MQDILLSEAYARWSAATECRISTQRGYSRAVRHAISSGIVFLSHVTRPRLQEHLNAMKKRGLTARSICNHLAALVAVLGQLELEGAFPLDTLESLRRLRPRMRALHAPGMARFITREEAERLAVAAAWIAPRIEFPVRVACLSGVRVGELARLAREDFELGDQPFLRVRNLPEWGERGSAKTGERRVPVCRELKALVLDRAPSSGWLFPAIERRSGRRLTAPFINRWTLETELVYARRAAGLPSDVTFTVLRHTRASWWLQADPPVSIYNVAAWMGHQVRVTELHYAGLLPYDPSCERMPA